MKTSSFVIYIFCALAVASPGWADIYRHDDGDETISFTDSPRDSRYTLILRDRRPVLPKALKERTPSLVPTTKKPTGQSDVQTTATSGDLPVQGVITSTTGYRNDPFNGRLTHHNGMDIAAPSGTPVKAVAPGTVVFSGWRGGYGNTVVIEHDDGMMTVYAHHSDNKVSEGDVVDRSTIIALSGSTGRSTGPHLHFEAWRHGENITPSFLPTGTGLQKTPAVASAPVKRYLQEDGTILFTNLR